MKPLVERLFDVESSESALWNAVDKAVASKADVLASMRGAESGDRQRETPHVGRLADSGNRRHAPEPGTPVEQAAGAQHRHQAGPAVCEGPETGAPGGGNARIQARIGDRTDPRLRRGRDLYAAARVDVRGRPGRPRHQKDPPRPNPTPCGRTPRHSH